MAKIDQKCPRDQEPFDWKETRQREAEEASGLMILPSRKLGQAGHGKRPPLLFFFLTVSVVGAGDFFTAIGIVSERNNVS